jgi:hypothetical protein
MDMDYATDLDIRQVFVDDALLMTIRSDDELSVEDPIDHRLAVILRAWWHDVYAEPIGHSPGQRGKHSAKPAWYYFFRARSFISYCRVKEPQR